MPLVALLLALALVLAPAALAQGQLGPRIGSGGHHVSLYGNRLAVGGTSWDFGGTSGVFEWDGSAWVQLGPDIFGEALDDDSGSAVSLSGYGERLAIGAPYNDGNGEDSGHVRVYQWDRASTAWVQLGDDIDGKDAHDRSGFSVSLAGDGDRLAIGAPNGLVEVGGVPSASRRHGYTRVYQWDRAADAGGGALGAWVQLGADIEGDQEVDLYGGFGWSVSLSRDGDRLAVGAPRYDGDSGRDSGQTRVFEWTDTATGGAGAWVQLGAALYGEARGDESGTSVSLSGDGNSLAIGAPLNDGNGEDSGHVRVHQWDRRSTAWVQLGDDIDGRSPHDLSGSSVSLSGDERLAVSGGPTRVYEFGRDWIQFGADLPRARSVSFYEDALAIDRGFVYEFSSPSASATLDGVEGWRMLASPEATTVGAFLEVLWTQGFTGSDAPAGECTVYVYDEAAASFAAGWTCATAAANPLAPGQGVMAYVFEDDDADTAEVQGGFPKTLSSSTAVLPYAPHTFSVAFTDDARPSGEKGWNLLGVPHGATLDWSLVDRTLVSPTTYVYDPAFNGGDYRISIEVGGAAYGDLPHGAIPPFQGFFVRAVASGAALVATARASDAPVGTYGRTAAPTVVRLALADASGERSAAWVALADGAALGPDAADAPRLEPTAWPRAVLFTTALGDGAPLIANVLPPDLGGATYADVPLDVAVAGETGPLALTLTATAEALPDGWTLTLVDRTTGAEAPLTNGATAPLTVAGDTGDASGIDPPDALTLPASLASPTALARLGAARYALRIATDAFATAPPDETPLATGLGHVSPNPTTGAATLTWSLAEVGAARVSVVDLLAREVAVLADGSFATGVYRAEVPAGRLAPGVYVVRLQAGTAVESARFTVAR